MKYVVVGRRPDNAQCEESVVRSAPVATYHEALIAAARWEVERLGALENDGRWHQYERVYAEVWIEDESGNRVTSPEKRGD